MSEIGVAIGHEACAALDQARCTARRPGWSGTEPGGAALIEVAADRLRDRAVLGRISEMFSCAIPCSASSVAWRVASSSSSAGRSRSIKRSVALDRGPGPSSCACRHAAVTSRAGTLSSSTGDRPGRAGTARSRRVPSASGRRSARTSRSAVTELGPVDRPVLALGIVEAMLPGAVLVRNELQRRAGVADAPDAMTHDARALRPAPAAARTMPPITRARARRPLRPARPCEVIQRARVSEHPRRRLVVQARVGAEEPGLGGGVVVGGDDQSRRAIGIAQSPSRHLAFRRRAAVDPLRHLGGALHAGDVRRRLLAEVVR